MTEVLAATTALAGADGRPVAKLPNRELVRISLYWLGLSSIFAGLSVIMTGRLEFTDLADKSEAGRTLFLISITGVIIAILVQPTIGSISDYTISRWGRRKPYIFIGSTARRRLSHRDRLEQHARSRSPHSSRSSNSARTSRRDRSRGTSRTSCRPPQVGTASALVGLMQVLGVVSGFVIGAPRDRDFHRYGLGLIALGVLEVRDDAVGGLPGPRGARRRSRARDGRGVRSPPRRGAPTSSRSAASSGWSRRAWRS